MFNGLDGRGRVVPRAPEWIWGIIYHFLWQKTIYWKKICLRKKTQTCDLNDTFAYHALQPEAVVSDTQDWYKDNQRQVAASSSRSGQPSMSVTVQNDGKQDRRYKGSNRTQGQGQAAWTQGQGQTSGWSSQRTEEDAEGQEHPPKGSWQDPAELDRHVATVCYFHIF